jgi:hypothetical protein
MGSKLLRNHEPTASTPAKLKASRQSAVTAVAGDSSATRPRHARCEYGEREDEESD